MSTSPEIQAADRILLDCAEAQHERRDGYGEVRFPGRGVIRVCTECWNRHVYARRETDRLRKEQAKEAGRDYWRSRGIEVGEQVVAYVGSWTGLGGERVIGTAKVGVSGAYVSAPRYQAGKLDPASFQKLRKDHSHATP